MELNVAICDFCTDQEFLGRAPLTRKRHRVELGLFGRWVEVQGLDWATIERAELQRYLRSRAGLSASGRANMLSTLRVFYGWAVEQLLVARSPVVGFGTPRRLAPLPRALTRPQVEQLLTWARSRDGLAARRAEMIVLTILYAGLRSCEIAGLRWEHIDLGACVLAIELSKMGKGRAVPIHPALAAELERWQVEQGAPAGGAVFGLAGKPITSGRVGKIMRKVAAGSKIRFSAHVLRHTFATWALRRSHDLYAVSKLLGHSQLKQTEIYISADVEQLRKAVEGLPDQDSWA